MSATKTEVQVSWVWTDDGDGNGSFGEISRSFQTSAFLTEKEADAVKAYLKPFFKAGIIMDVYVGPVGKSGYNFKDLMRAIKKDADLVPERIS